MNRYMEDRWPCAMVAVTSCATSGLIVACSAFSYFITRGDLSYSFTKTLEGQDFLHEGSYVVY